MINESKNIAFFGSISNEKDLKIKAGNNINPPPVDGTCYCCGRHISELKTFLGKYTKNLFLSKVYNQHL